MKLITHIKQFFEGLGYFSGFDTQTPRCAVLDLPFDDCEDCHECHGILCPIRKNNECDEALECADDVELLDPEKYVWVEGVPL